MSKYSFGILCLVISNFASAQYFLKFSTSGATHVPSSGYLSANGGAWIDVSIVDTHPVDGPIHWPGSDTGAYTSVYRYGSGVTLKKNEVGDELHFYVARVPRSLTIIASSTGLVSTITAGEQPTRFTGAPSFLLPDQMLVATGMSFYHSWYPGAPAPVRKIYIAATMPLKMIPYQYAANWGKTTTIPTSEASCGQGWTESGRNPGILQVWQMVNVTGQSYTCTSALMYAGPLSHVVLEQ